MRGFASAQQHWDRAWTDPCELFQCHVFDAIGAIVGGGDLFGALFGGGIAADAAAAAAPAVAADVAAPLTVGAVDAAIPATVLPDVLTTAVAPDVAGIAGSTAAADAAGLTAGADIGATAAGTGAGVLAPFDALTGTFPGLTDALGGAPITGDVAGAAGPTLSTGGAVGGAAAPITVTPPATTAALPSTISTGFAGPSAASPVAPATAGAAGTGTDIGATGAGIGSATGTATPTTTAIGTTTGASPLSGDVLGPGEADYVGGGAGGTATATGPAADTGTAAAGTAAAGGAATQPQGFLSKLLGPQTMASIKEFSPLVSALGMGYNLLQANKSLPGQAGTASIPSNLQAILGPAGTTANTAGTSIGAAGSGQIAQGQTLEGYLSSGTLPPAIQSAISSAAEATKAGIRSQYANRGMTGSSAEAQDLAAADERAQQAGTNVALQLFSQGATLVGAGTSELGSQANIAVNVGGMDLSGEQLAAQIYQQITNTAIQQDTALGNSIASFSNALAGGSRPGTVTVNLAGTPAGTTATQAAA